MVGPPFLMLTLLTLMLPLRATLTLLSGRCNIFASYNAKLAVFFKFRFAFVVSCEFRFNGSGYAGIDGLSRIVDIRASAARIGRTGGDIGNAARVDLSVGIGATDEDGG